MKTFADGMGRARVLKSPWELSLFGEETELNVHTQLFAELWLSESWCSRAPGAALGGLILLLYGSHPFLRPQSVAFPTSAPCPQN